jgi:hypothetical protein
MPVFLKPAGYNDLAHEISCEDLDRPILTMDGEEVRIAESVDGGPCGTEDAGVH